ncbi:hypothetical protein BDB01DRAFT_800918 [Pilobolus umbonatus]|nr:hypothetical protein BDB01DRAFT_800918 [Pilobolus umbonatus]
MLRQLNNLTRLTSTSLKCAANNTAVFVGLSSREDTGLPSPETLNDWIHETQQGLDAFFNDQFELAEHVFLQHHEESPFHAVGYALMAYVEAMLGFETERIEIALDRIAKAEVLCRYYTRKSRKRYWRKGEESDIQYELLASNCMLMSSTIQFLRNSWFEYMKAAYKLRKAYKLYEHMFESLTGQKASDYASLHSSSSSSSVSTTTTTTTSSLHVVKRREYRSETALDYCENAVESGIFFGIGLFSLIFSLLPPRVNKLLNSLGFHSSRPFALHLLQRSFINQGLYSSLSALSLLVYYTNLSLFVHPKLLPNSLSLESVRQILDQMKAVFPEGKMWKLLEGKICRMEGNNRKAVEILRDARRTTKRSSSKPVYEFIQIQALTVYEMGWAQIFLCDYFQAAETFFRLESMNNWSKAFYHYIATCCMFADEEYDKAAIEFMQIPVIIKRKRQLGGRLLPNEIFAERKVNHWKQKDHSLLNGNDLQDVVIHPLWELIYLWNGFSQLDTMMLEMMKQTMEDKLAKKEATGPDLSQLYLLLGVSVRELGDYDLAELYITHALSSEDITSEDRWVVPHALYELAVICCIRLTTNKGHHHLIAIAQEWIRQSERRMERKHPGHEDPLAADGDSDWDSRLHIRCQLLKEKLNDFGHSHSHLI